MNELRYCYKNLKDLIGQDIEPFDVVNTVDDYRMYFKPKKVRVLLLAESHVYTSMDDFRITMDLKEFNLMQPYPNTFVRFVYCLGYGENKLLQSKVEKNNGTPDFWKIFFSCCNPVQSKEVFSPILKTTSTEDRITNKISLLNRLKEQGIWLVDASIIGINDKHNPGNDKYEKTLSICWKYYIKNVIAEASPENIIIIGKGVGKVLEEKVWALFNKKPLILPLPNAYLSQDKKMDLFKTIHAVVNDGKCYPQESIAQETGASQDSLQKTVRAAMPPKKETIKKKALHWFKANYGNIDEPVYASRYYTPKDSYTGTSAWWIQVPRKYYHSDASRFVHFLCQKSPGANYFYYLRVPCEYLQTHEASLSLIGDKISLFLSAEAKNIFQDEKGPSKIQFGQFLVNKNRETH